MKTIVYKKYGPPDVLQLKKTAEPIPKDHEILVKVKATTVTAADIRARSFTVPPFFWLPARITLGFRQPKKEVLGVELAGEIVSVGKDVKRFKEGDQVFAASLEEFGAYAEYKCLSEDGPVSIKPSNISYAEAAAIPIGARTALYFLRKAKIQSGQKVLIYGASGSVGSYAVQIAKHFGANVTGVCSTSNLEWVKSLGADKVIDYTSEDFSTGAELYDVIFEAVNKSSFTDCIKVLKKDGTYINITEPLPSFLMLWTTLTTGKKLILSRNAPETPEALNFLGELVEMGKLKVIIDRSFDFEEIVEAHRYVEKGHKKGNVIINVELHNKS
ncbi:NAD(P)-dependent alcohol dehydrogenase [Terribacillus saccharophilus]|jgi:NADPH:quinone reductase-like Zn-dependent oxidoreductase|uniref:NAD(P)-dependent alcohol dehydrogenase n=1 Tax=Terribacillus saccharophilus TaxID=361277 RepID=A0A268H8Y9_9BACI|nr:NAD(P)-dependent alcohol dehydrogenase [Terribacillus saccharophilus]PAD33865.1 NAD(P)-dependent alcohol dehydrogenase [Terribacillus saccharophilus]PAD94600.1 NAD(P)-dependent alcohol dehydrogenase [Terribacillus saccharophilus]PAD98280.1 NAD(P)-dependent alcohol dehydrogenase [Terribacillus saccharophilus]PAE06347.1 NAD(P)-dependent alcohol dehydrogenase [Terribacillus saccharophilus]